MTVESHYSRWLQRGDFKFMAHEGHDGWAVIVDTGVSVELPTGLPEREAKTMADYLNKNKQDLIKLFKEGST